jgi:hypothetical protein
MFDFEGVWTDLIRSAFQFADVAASTFALLHIETRTALAGIFAYPNIRMQAADIAIL